MAVARVTSHRQPKQDRSRATRARLVDAAIDSLAELGWTASTISDVAERAGVSRGAAQHHFPTRESLYVAALEQVWEARAEQLAGAVRRDRPVRTAEVVDAVFELYAGTTFRAALQMWVAAASEPSLREMVIPLEARLGREVHRMVVGLLDADESVAGVRETVQATLDLARGLGLANLLTDDSRRRRAIAREWARTLDLRLHRGELPASR
jgi:AcrR family transcriptional regulator